METPWLRVKSLDIVTIEALAVNRQSKVNMTKTTASHTTTCKNMKASVLGQGGFLTC
jgi:hypothetical protein